MKKFLRWMLVGIFFAPIFALYKDFKKRYDFGLYYINLEEEANQERKYEEAESQARKLFFRPENYSNAMDLRGTPTHVCACGCDIWNLKVCFDDYQISNYFLDMECANCGSIATAPTPIDKEAN
jgi:hypothetical protein